MLKTRSRNTKKLALTMNKKKNFELIREIWRERCETLELHIPGSKDHKKRFPERY